MTQMIFEQTLIKCFLLVLNMSLTACVVIMAVLLARLALKKAPKIFSYALWVAVLFRLLSPVSFSLPVSLLGALQNEPAKAGRMEYIAQDIAYMEKPEIALPTPGFAEVVNERLPLGTPEASANPMQIYLAIGAYLWILGVLSMGVYSILSFLQLRKRLKGAVHDRENIYRIRGKGSPFVYGLFRPKIYLPENLTGEEERYILLHEQIHIKRGDAVWRLLSYLTLLLHWFNPLVWAAFTLSGRDMELSCDEAVISRLGSKVKQEYSASLLNISSGRQIVKGIPLAFGESDTGSRIKNVLRYKKPVALLAGCAAVLSAVLAVLLLANPARARENTNIYYGVVTQDLSGGEENILRIPGLGDVVLPEAKDISLYLERDAEEIIMPGDLLRITFSPDQEITLTATEQYGQTLYRFDSVSGAEAESIQVMGEGFSMTRQEDDRYLFTVPIGMAAEAQAGDILEIYHYPKADTTEEIYRFPQGEDLGQELLTSAEVLSVDEENYDIWVELTAEEAEVFLSEFGFGVSVKLIRMPKRAGEDELSESVLPEYANVLSEDTGSELLSLSPERLANQELLDGMYVVYVRSVSRSARGFDRYVTEEDYDDLPLFPFAESCVFRVNRSMDKFLYEETDFDTFADLVTDAVEVINPPVYCEVVNNQIVRADLQSAFYRDGIAYAEPENSDWGWRSYLETAMEDWGMAAEEVLESFYTLAGTENADIGDSAGTERIEVYTGNIGDGESGLAVFKNADGKELSTEFAHSARAGWNNVYIGEAEGTGYILTVHIEDRDTYGEYGYQVYRLGETGEIRQIAGSSFTFGDNYRYDDEMFRIWADGLSYYLENSHLILSSQEGEIRTEQVPEADKYNYETLKRGT